MTMAQSQLTHLVPWRYLHHPMPGDVTSKGSVPCLCRHNLHGLVMHSPLHDTVMLPSVPQSLWLHLHSPLQATWPMRLRSSWSGEYVSTMFLFDAWWGFRGVVILCYNAIVISRRSSPQARLRYSHGRPYHCPVQVLPWTRTWWVWRHKVGFDNSRYWCNHDTVFCLQADNILLRDNFVQLPIY